MRIAGTPASRRPGSPGAQGARRAPGALRAANTVQTGAGHDQRGLSPAAREIGTRRRELAPAIHQAFDAFSNKVFADGALPEKAKQLIAVAVAHVTQCPYCIAGHTKLTGPAQPMKRSWKPSGSPPRCWRAVPSPIPRWRCTLSARTVSSDHPRTGWPDTRSHSSCTPWLRMPSRRAVRRDWSSGWPAPMLSAGSCPLGCAPSKAPTGGLQGNQRGVPSLSRQHWRRVPRGRQHSGRPCLTGAPPADGSGPVLRTAGHSPAQIPGPAGSPGATGLPCCPGRCPSSAVSRAPRLTNPPDGPHGRER